jgi:4-hydroxy-tetrahydrodipicolinate synthase
MHPAISGLWPALLHPLTAQGALDSDEAVAHARTLLNAGCDGVALFGTMGEGPAFSVAERMALLQAMLDGGVLPEQMVVTISAMALADAVALGQHALARGVQRQMLMPPFYFKQPRDAGVVQAVSEVVSGIGSADLRLVLYHFPAISMAPISHAALAELLRRHPQQIVGIKDSSGDLEHTLSLVRTFAQLSVLVGSEAQVAPVLCAGGAGSICGLANLAPRLMARIVAQPAQVAPADADLLARLLALQNLQPAMPFVALYKTLMAEQSGKPGWLRVRAPLSLLEPTEQVRVRKGYRDLGPLLQTR